MKNARFFFSQNPDVAEGAGADGLAKRLFAARVELVGEVDGKRPDRPPPFPNLARQLEADFALWLASTGTLEPARFVGFGAPHWRP
jgi:hypothetical protein